jgi:TonB family protein
MKDSKPVDVYSTLEIRFHILGKWHLARADFHLPQGASRPIVEKGGAPRVAIDGDGATATMNFDIDEHGNPVNLRVENASDDGWASDVTSALRKWKFAPATKDGTPISIPCTMEFVRGN